MLGFQKVSDFAAGGRNGGAADLGRVAFGDAVEDLLQAIVGQGSDFLAAFGIVIIEDFLCSKAFDELLVWVRYGAGERRSG